jgi:hypothetical protein
MEKDMGERQVNRGRRLLPALLLVGLIAMLAACGGSGDSGPSGSVVPVFAGAERLDSDEKGDLYDAFGYKTRDAFGTVYRSDRRFEDVITYYSEGIGGEGWHVIISQQFLDGVWTVMTTRDDVVAMLTIMTGSAVHLAPTLAGLDEYQINAATITADQTVIIVHEYTCEEQDVTSCTALRT